MISLDKPGNRVENLSIQEGLFFQAVYLWMVLGLVLTGVTAYFTFGFASALAASPGLFLFFAVLQIAIVIGLSFGMNKLPLIGLQIGFIVYSVITGVTFSLLGLVYSTDVMFKAFLSTAAIYGTVAFYGYTTKRDLQGLGLFFFMALIGFIVMGIVYMIFPSRTLDLIIGWGGVLLFSGITAYDHQKLRLIFSSNYKIGEETLKKVAIMGALSLYLDFINLFLSILRIFGGGNRN